jgi:hypothetical protein
MDIHVCTAALFLNRSKKCDIKKWKLIKMEHQKWEKSKNGNIKKMETSKNGNIKKMEIKKMKHQKMETSKNGNIKMEKISIKLLKRLNRQKKWKQLKRK